MPGGVAGVQPRMAAPYADGRRQIPLTKKLSLTLPRSLLTGLLLIPSNAIPLFAWQVRFTLWESGYSPESPFELYG